MQASLVAFYGYDKPKDFLHLICDCQNALGGHLESVLKTYPIEQVHATIIGMEAVVLNNKIWNSNFKDINEEREMLFGKLIDIWKNLESFTIQIGGWGDKANDFKNGMKETPYEGSFFIRNGLAGSMGWPIDDSNNFPKTLYAIRKQFEEANILHRWHRNPEFIDNDFFFRIGVTSLSDDDSLVINARHSMRKILSEHCPVNLTVSPDDLCVVAYNDNKLPWNQDKSTRSYLRNISVDWLRNVYNL